ncbi:hypothetical protein F0U60_41325 [Archangium minus]|uniref:Uncharacterized protein n=1 Tax=Archangium minus TaxID=83450 RepID=A0ABY9X3C5_9BACT|nr:hypothetical protein F0U61_41415 [Archangium violaceum]WNG49848.1 hypothetical protein F0U60_41325 [Archangium minus]
MWLILCNLGDPSALWAYQGLKARGLSPLELISAEELMYSPRWRYHLSSRGASFELDLPSHRRLHSEDVQGVLNRLGMLPTEHLLAASPVDRDYAAQELGAFIASWLQSLPGRVINRPSALALAGRYRHPSEWTWLASRAGLPVVSFHQSSEDNGALRGQPGPALLGYQGLLVLEGELFGPPVPATIREGSIQLATLARTSLLGLSFANNGVEPWVFTGATPLPDLRPGGPALLDHLARQLRAGTEVQS